MKLIVQPLLESRTYAYIEWLCNKLILTANNNINKNSPLVLLSAKRKSANHKAYHNPWSRKIIPTSRVSLASTLCIYGLFTPVVGAACGVAIVWRILLVGTNGSLYLIVRCLF